MLCHLPSPSLRSGKAFNSLFYLGKGNDNLPCGLADQQGAEVCG